MTITKAADDPLKDSSIQSIKLSSVHASVQCISLHACLSVIQHRQLSASITFPITFRPPLSHVTSTDRCKAWHRVRDDKYPADHDVGLAEFRIFRPLSVGSSLNRSADVATSAVSAKAYTARRARSLRTTCLE